MSKQNTLHDLAAALRQMADKLDAATDTPLAQDDFFMVHLWFREKPAFIAAVRAIGGTKVFNEYDCQVSNDIGLVRTLVKLPRNKACRLIEPARPAVYECDPILSDADLNGVAQ